MKPADTPVPEFDSKLTLADCDWLRSICVAVPEIVTYNVQPYRSAIGYEAYRRAATLAESAAYFTDDPVEGRRAFHDAICPIDQVGHYPWEEDER